MVMSQFSYSGGSNGKFEVSIGSLDDPTLTVHAQFRPGDLQIDQAVPWVKHPNRATSDELQLEFTGGEGRSSSMLLVFDASESGNTSVEVAIANLTMLATPTVHDPGVAPANTPGVLKRPHHCVLVFGRVFNQKSYKCVIESISTKISMFSPTGSPIRAHVTVKFKEASRVSTSAAPSGGDTAAAPAAPAAAGA